MSACDSTDAAVVARRDYVIVALVRSVLSHSVKTDRTNGIRRVNRVSVVDFSFAFIVVRRIRTDEWFSFFSGKRDAARNEFDGLESDTAERICDQCRRDAVARGRVVVIIIVITIIVIDIIVVRFSRGPITEHDV